MNKIYTGTGYINPNVLDKMIDKNENIIVVDSSEIYLNKYYDKLSKSGYDIKILNLKEHMKSNLFNALDYPYYLYKKGDVEASTELIHDITNIITFTNNGSDPFWSESAAALLTGTILLLFEDANKDEINLKSVYKMLSAINESFNNTDKLTEYFKLKDENSVARITSSIAINAPYDTKSSIAAIAGVKTSTLVNDFYNATIKNADIKIEEFKQNKKALFITSSSKSHSTIISILLNELLCIGKNTNPRCNVLINNLNGLDYIAHLEEYLQTSQYNNIMLYVNIGSKNAFKENYKISCLDNLSIEPTVNLKFKKGNVIYPKTKQIDSIKCFDIDLYFKENNIVNEVKTTVDDLIKEIEKKLKELEK